MFGKNNCHTFSNLSVVFNCVLKYYHKKLFWSKS